jgi:predicted transcriptional regulator
MRGPRASRDQEGSISQKRNLTIQLDSEVIRKARILAAERSTSVSRLVAEQLERLVGEEEQYRAAYRQAMADLDSGFHLGGGLMPRREDLHDR